MAEQHAAIAAAIENLRQEYLAKLPQEMSELAHMASALAGPGNVQPVLESLRRRLHRLAGSGGTFGLDALSEQSRALEETVREWLAADVHTIDSVDCTRFSAAVLALAETSGPRQSPANETSSTG